jgi:hypothetical protein
MSCRPLAVLAPLALVAMVAPVAAAVTAPAHTKKQAEVNVLRVVAQKFGARRLQGLVNPRTRLLADNTEAVCRGRGKRTASNRYSRFVCVVRPHVHTRGQGLYVSYRASARGRFRIRWLLYRRH